MKKLLLVLTIVLTLSGCSVDTPIDTILGYESCIDNDPFFTFNADIICYDENGLEYEYTEELYSRLYTNKNIFYTQEEVDEMFNHLYDVVLPALENALIDNYLLIEQYEDDIDEILDYYDIMIAELQLQIDELGE